MIGGSLFSRQGVGKQVHHLSFTVVGSPASIRDTVHEGKQCRITPPVLDDTIIHGVLIGFGCVLNTVSTFFLNSLLLLV